MIKSLSILFFIIHSSLFSFGQKKNLYNPSERGILKKSFYALSDSILLNEDIDNQLDTLYKLSINKQIVAIGEVTHATEEVLQFQTLIARNLVEKHHFKCIVLGEIGLIDSYKFNDFVINGRGNINSIGYRQVRFIKLLKWVQGFNSDKPFHEKIWIIGTDIEAPAVMLCFIEEYCKQFHLTSAMPIIEEINKLLEKGIKSNEGSINTIQALSLQLTSILNESRNQIDSSNLKIDIMIRGIAIMPKILPFLTNFNLGYKVRDKFIFENIDWLIQSCKKDKIVIIKSHNFHVNKKTIYTELFGKFPTFGEYLNNTYKDKYLSIGTEIQKGTFYNGTLPYSEVIEHPHKLGNIIGEHLSSKYSILFSDGLLRPLLNKKNLKISYGTLNYPGYVTDCKGVLGDAFDALIFIKNSTPYQFIYYKNSKVIKVNE